MHSREFLRAGATALGLLLSVSAGGQVTAPAQPDVLTLAEARRAAIERSPAVAAAAAAVEEAQGRLITARTYPYNPEIEVEAASRSGGEADSTDGALGVSQEIEIAGQRGRRVAAARAALAAAEARLERQRLAVLAEVTQRFAEALRATELHELAAAEVALTGELVELEERRLEAGAGTQIAVNVARAAAGRAARALREIEADRAEARARLAESAGLPAVGGVEAALPVAVPPPPQVGLAALTARALAERDDLSARRLDLEEARRRVALQRALAVPNLRVGAFAEREEGADVFGAAVAIPIPLFDRNRGAIAEAEAATDRAAAELATAELAVGREVASALAHYESAAAAASDLERLVVGTLEGSVDLLRRSLDAGKIGAGEVLLLRRELFEARREAVEAATEALAARAALELAVGGLLDEEVTQ